MMLGRIDLVRNFSACSMNLTTPTYLPPIRMLPPEYSHQRSMHSTTLPLTNHRLPFPTTTPRNPINPTHTASSVRIVRLPCPGHKSTQ